MSDAETFEGKARLRGSRAGLPHVSLAEFKRGQNVRSYFAADELQLLSPPFTVSDQQTEFFLTKSSHPLEVGMVRPPKSQIFRRSDVFVIMLKGATGILFDRTGLLLSGNYLEKVKNPPTWLTKHEDCFYPNFDYLNNLPVEAGTFAVYFDGNTHNYKHWWIDMLMPWHAITTRVGVECKTLMPIRVDQMPQWQRDSIKILNIKTVVEPPVGAEVLRLEEVVYVERAGVPANPYDGLSQFRADVLAGFGGLGTPMRRIYLKRVNAGRPIVNEDDVEAAMRARGFQVVVPEALGAEGQITLFRNAGFVVGNHGAAFANMLFSPPKACFLEFMPETEMRMHYWALANGLGQRHGFLRCEALDKSFWGDMRVNIADLILLIEKFDRSKSV